MAHDHYKKDVRHLDMIDVYRVLALWNVTDPCIQHAVKKLLVAGGRGAGKSFLKDIQEAIDSLERCKDMLAEDGGEVHVAVESQTTLIDKPEMGFRGVIDYHSSGVVLFRIFHSKDFQKTTVFCFDEHGRYTGYTGPACRQGICEWVYRQACSIFDSRKLAETPSATGELTGSVIEEMSK